MKKLGVTSNQPVVPQGFTVSGIHAGIKRSQKRDLGLIYSPIACECAGLFTANKVKAESLKICMRHLQGGKKIKAIVVNSGNANCFVGKPGENDAVAVVKAVAKQLRISAREALIASTGIIGKQLPINTILGSTKRLCRELHEGSYKDFAQSILTTDRCIKTITVKTRIDGRVVMISGVAKGAGMIAPHLVAGQKHATMLAFIMTDASISKSLLSFALQQAVEHSFNCITVDGCMSTNDTVLALANGLAGNKKIIKKDKHFSLFSERLMFVCSALSGMIIADAEGATKNIVVVVKNAKNKKVAEQAAKSIANSNLFKTAMYGNNPNWGRIVAALGAAGVALEHDKLKITLNNRIIFSHGKSCIFPRNLLKGARDIVTVIDVKQGRSSYDVCTSDLTPAYVKINAEYN